MLTRRIGRRQAWRGVSADPESRFWRIAIVPNVYVAPKQTGGREEDAGRGGRQLYLLRHYNGLTVSYQYFSTVLHLYGGISYSAGHQNRRGRPARFERVGLSLMIGICCKRRCACSATQSWRRTAARRRRPTTVKNKIDQHLKKYFILRRSSCCRTRTAIFAQTPWCGTFGGPRVLGAAALRCARRWRGHCEAVLGELQQRRAACGWRRCTGIQ